jgi:DnaK suppressor protein
VGAINFGRYTQLLLAKRRDLVHARADGANPVPGAGGQGGDLMDQATADTNALLHIRLRQTDGRLLRAIEEALARIRQGTYGVCSSCGQSISKARLNAVPWTRLCRDCKERQQG